MSGTAKTVLIAAGVGVAAVLLYKAFQPSPLIKKTVGTSATSTLSISGLTGLFNSIGGLFGGGSSSGSGVVADRSAYGYGVLSVDTAAEQGYALGHGVVDQQGNQLIDLNTGNALTYGTD